MVPTHSEQPKPAFQEPPSRPRRRSRPRPRLGELASRTRTRTTSTRTNRFMLPMRGQKAVAALQEPGGRMNLLEARSAKTNVPAEPSSPAGTKWGVGVRHALFPRLALGARIGCQLPDAILHGKRSLRPRSRAVQRLAATELLSEAFQLAWAGGCATGPQTWSRHICD